MANPWSKNGVALYPPKYPVVGQSRVFNALVNFRQQFSEHGDLSGFFVIVGDWGLGKTRIGYELVAEATGRIDKWLLDPSREFVAPNTNRRVLAQQFADGILPLFIDYRSVTDNLAADLWTPKVACNALSLLWERPKDLRVSPDLLDDLVAALKARGVNLNALQQAMQTSATWKSRLESAMQVLQAQGIRYLWVIVDEVETPSDLKRNPDYTPGTEVEEEDLAMISHVIKEARYREDFPYLNFLLLCSLGMSDAIQIGPNRRRTDLLVLEPNRIYDLKTFQNHLAQAGVAVDYPPGTLEGIFIATNRNFGWFNKVMSAVHAIWEDAELQGNPFDSAWRLIQTYALGAASNKEVFDLSILEAMSGIPKGSLEEVLAQQMIYGQLPVLIDPQVTPAEVTQRLLKANIPGVGDAFARLSQVHIDANALANELLKPEYGFKKSEHAGDDYYNPYTEFSLSGVLSALRAFSISVDDGEDFVIYDDLEQFTEQLASLYPRELIQSGKSIEQAAEPLHEIFSRYTVKNKEYIGVSFKLLKKVNVKMGGEGRPVSFFRDRTLDQKIEAYAQEQAKHAKTRMSAICKGMAKVLDDVDHSWLNDVANDEVAFVSIESDFKAPQMPGLDVTLKGRVTVAYCGEPQKTANELADLLGKQTEAVRPILVLFGPSSDLDGFRREIERKPVLSRCVILRKITTFEEEFLLKYSGRGSVFNPGSEPLSQGTLAIRENLRQDLQSQFRTWKQDLEAAGMILRPIWAKSTNIAKEDFFIGYRYLLSKDGNIDDLDPATCQIPGWANINLENFRNAAKKNVNPGHASTAELLPVLEEDEPYRPAVPAALLRVLHELHDQASEDNLAKRFFFANRETEVPGKQTTQVLELLEALGVVFRPVAAQYMAVNKNYFDGQRTKIKQWLQNEAPTLIKEIQDIFPARTIELEKNYLPMAKNYLVQVDEIAVRMQLGFIETGELDKDSYKKLVKDVYAFEDTIKRICPLDPYQSFSLSTEQIKSYQDNYTNLSLWEKVHFLRWLRSQYIDKQNHILATIDKQLEEVPNYKYYEDKPFPTAPLTQALRLIQNEVQTPITGGTQTSMGLLEIPDYPLKISQYFVANQYVEGWKRMDKLEAYASKTGSSSLWQRFVRQYEEWKAIVNLYLQAKQAWEGFNAFMNDAPERAKTSLTEIGKVFQALEDLVDEGLEHDIQGQISAKPGLALMDALEAEVRAASKYQGLADRISTLWVEIHQKLKNKINAKRLEALNHALRADGKPEWVAPEGKATYQQTVDAYESFNAKVDQQGKSLFEGKGRKTNWELWVEIYTKLDSGTDTPALERDEIVSELCQIGLLVRRISLKR